MIAAIPVAIWCAWIIGTVRPCVCFIKQFETDYRDAAAFDKSLSLVAGGEDSHNAVFANAYADVVKIYAIRCVDAFYVEFRGSLRGCGDVDAAVAAMESFLDAVFSAEGE